MIAIAHFAGLVVTTLFAAFAAVLLDWVFLKAMFQLMRPATVRAIRVEKNGLPQKVAASTAFVAGAQNRTQAKAHATSFGSELVQGTREIARQFGEASVRR